MAAIESKRSVSLAQPGARKKRSATNPQPSAPKRPKRSRRQHRDPKKPEKPERLPASLRYTETKRGKTTIRRYDSRRRYRFEEVKGKLVDFVEVFTAGEYHSIDVPFQDKTAMHFVIDPGFILDTEYADWKTGDWRPIKRWPLIHSQTLRA